jgi:hypothetical protein
MNLALHRRLLLPSLLVLALAGCLTEDADKDPGAAPTLVSQPSDTTVVEGTTARFRVEATGDALEYQWVRNGADTLEGKTSATLTLTNVALSRNGSTYHCIVRNGAGRTASNPATLTVVADSAPDTVVLTVKTLTAGAQSNATYGSSIDLDDFTSHTLSQAMGMTAEIDLIFAYSTALNAGSAIYSPDSAKYGVGGSSGFDFMQGFNNPNHTVIKSVNVSFTSITTKAQLDSLWLTVPAVNNGRLYVTTGTTFMARSNEQRVVLMRVQSLITGAEGQVSLQGSAKF